MATTIDQTKKVRYFRSVGLGFAAPREAKEGKSDRFEKRHTSVPVHCSPCFDVKDGYTKGGSELAKAPQEAEQRSRGLAEALPGRPPLRLPEGLLRPLRLTSDLHANLFFCERRLRAKSVLK